MAFILFSSSVMAQELLCAPRNEVLDSLSKTNGEDLVFTGIRTIPLQGNMQWFEVTALMEFTANPRTGSWTVLMTRPSGISCFVFGGTKFNSYIPDLGSENKEQKNDLWEE